MSIDRSLKIRGALKRHRNVLTRAERVEQLKDEERWSEGDSLFALPKVAHRKSHAGRKAAKEEAAVAATEGVAGAEAPAAAETTPVKAPTGKTPAAKVPVSKAPVAKAPAAKAPAGKKEEGKAKKEEGKSK